MLGTHCFKTGLSPMAVGLCAGAEPAAQCARGHPLHLLLTKAFNCMSPSARAGSCRRCLGNARKIWLWHSVALFYLLYCSKNIWPLLKRARLDAYITACSRNSTCWLAQFLQLKVFLSAQQLVTGHGVLLGRQSAAPELWDESSWEGFLMLSAGEQSRKPLKS